MKAHIATSKRAPARLLLATVLSALLVPWGCSTSDPVGQTSVQMEKNAAGESGTRPGESGNGTTSTTTSIQGGSSQDYTGTVDPELIAAAYLVCGKDDDQGNAIGCNLYEQRTDRRVPTEKLPDGRWVARVEGGTARTVNPASLRSKVKVSFAFQAETSSAMSGQSNPRVEVGFLSLGVSKRFASRIQSMAMIEDFDAFGRVSNLAITRNQNAGNGGQPNLSRFLSSHSNLRATQAQCMMQGPLTTFNVDRCQGKTYFRVYNFTQPLVPDYVHVGTLGYCDSVANLFFNILCP